MTVRELVTRLSVYDGDLPVCIDKSMTGTPRAYEAEGCGVRRRLVRGKFESRVIITSYAAEGFQRQW